MHTRHLPSPGTVPLSWAGQGATTAGAEWVPITSSVMTLQKCTSSKLPADPEELSGHLAQEMGPQLPTDEVAWSPGNASPWNCSPMRFPSTAQAAGLELVFRPLRPVTIRGTLGATTWDTWQECTHSSGSLCAGRTASPEVRAVLRDKEENLTAKP